MDTGFEIIDHTILHGEWERAMNLLVDLGHLLSPGPYSISDLGRIHGFAESCNRIPLENALTNPGFLVLRINTNLLLGNTDRAGMDLGAVDPETVDAGDGAWLYMLRAKRSQMLGDTAMALDNALKALVTQRTGAALLHAGAMLMQSGNVREAVPLLREALDGFRDGVGSDPSISAGELLTDAVRMTGDLTEAYSLCRRLIGVSPANPGLGVDCLHTRRKGLLSARAAVILYEWNLLEEARRNLDQALRLAGGIGHFDALCLGLVYEAKLGLAGGDASGAERALDTMAEWSRKPMDSRHAAHMRLCTAEIQLMRNRPAAAETLLGPRTIMGDDASDPNRYRPLLLARVDMARGRMEEALRFLTDIIGFARTNGYTWLLLDCLVYAAKAHAMRSEEGMAIDRTAEALAVGAGQGFIRTFVDKGPIIGELITKTGSCDPYTTDLLRAFAKANALTLTPRERGILGMIAEGYRNADIGRHLHISEGTVRKHVESLYRKLGVTSRTQAMKAGLSLGLV